MDDIDKLKTINLDSYKQQYKNFEITDKQIKFIQKLGGNIDDISQILKRDITEWKQISHKDVTKCILVLKDRQKASEKQINLIRSLYTDDELKNLLKINSDIEISKGHVKQLLTNVDKFRNKYVDFPIESTSDYEYGYQTSDLCENHKMYYLKFYNLLTLDYDGINYNQLIEILRPYKEDHLFRIYQTYNGYHVFIISATYEHKDYLTVEFMKSLKCDLFYILFSYNNGYKIRLSKKIGRNEKYVVKFIQEYGNGQRNTECDNLIKIHDSFNFI